LEPTGAYVESVSGRLIDGFTRAPITDGQVILQSCEAERCFRVAAEYSDESGHFRFERDDAERLILAGEFQILAFDFDHQDGSTRRFHVGEGENSDVGDVVLPAPPILFSDIEPCAAIPVGGATCTYSAGIQNTTTAALSGVALSLVQGRDARLRFEVGKRAGDDVLRRTRVELPPLASRRVSFSFDVPAFLPTGTQLCTTLKFGLDPEPLFTPARTAFLFCVEKTASGFHLLDAGETRTALDALREAERS